RPDLHPPKRHPRGAIRASWAVIAQTLVTLAIIFGASQLFVRQLEWAGPALGLPAAVVALLLSPIATELPEVLNASIWVRQGKTHLALANLSGAMMIQATVPSGIGILGGFNWSSQHLDRGGVDGKATWVEYRVDGAVADEVPGSAVLAA